MASKKYCAVKGCFINSDDCISFFRYPLDPLRCSIWVKNTRRKDLQIKTSKQLYDNYRICSRHFTDEMFTNITKCKLRINAFPTLFDFEHHPTDTEAPLQQLSTNNSLRVLTGCAESANQFIGQYSEEKEKCHPIENCLKTKEKINKYCEIQGVDGNGQVTLNRVQQFQQKQILSNESDTDINTIDLEEKMCNETEENIWKTEINVENSVETEISLFDHKTEVYVKTEYGENYIKAEENENFKIEDREIYIKNEPNEMKNEPAHIESFPDTTTLSHSTMENRIYESDSKDDWLVDQDLLEVLVYKCKNCSFKSKHKSSLKEHVLTHQDLTEVAVYKCKICLFKTIHKRSLPRHMLTHQDVTEIAVYKCEQCSYETKHNNCLKSHMVIHQDLSAAMYKCNNCSYKTKRKSNLRSHMLIHRDLSKITMYKCDHILTNKEPSQAPYMYEICSYATNCKFNLSKHMRLHQDTSEVTMYKCELCSFETRYKNSLKMHMVIHQDRLQVKVYMCEKYSHKTNNKFSLKKHMLTHQDFSGVTVYACEKCPYKTKNKYSLKRHMLIHQDPSNIAYM